MTAKEYLQQIKMLEIELQHFADEIKRINDMLGVQGISYDKETSGSGDSNSRERLIIHRLEMIDKFQKKINDANDKRFDIWNQLKQWLTAEELMIIKLRYFDFKGWKDISKAVNYTIKHCFDIHITALRKIDNNVSKCDITM